MENYDRYMHIMEYYSAMKMKKRNNMVQSQMHYAKLKKPDSRGYILYNSIYMIF